MQKRINEIDALRAITLLGILLTHTAQVFCFSNEYSNLSYLNLDNNCIVHIILLLLSNKCRIIFCILFGVSFWLLLKNSSYSNGKFFWRCIILICFGLFNKIFYTTEILMWYGLCGIFLIPVRKLETAKILFCFCFFYLVFLCIRTIDITIFENDFYVRYKNHSLLDIVSYPIYLSVLDYLAIFFPKGLIETMAYFLFGYYIGKSGFISNLRKNVNFKILLILIGFYFITTLLYHDSFNKILGDISFFIGALTYSYFFIYLYIRFKLNLIALESYGKMGLTNYSCQNIFGVMLMSLVLIPYKYTIDEMILFMITFYFVQMFFSYLWLKHNLYGPMEMFWRNLTNICYKK